MIDLSLLESHDVKYYYVWDCRALYDIVSLAAQSAYTTGLLMTHSQLAILGNYLHPMTPPNRAQQACPPHPHPAPHRAQVSLTTRRTR